MDATPNVHLTEHWKILSEIVLDRIQKDENKFGALDLDQSLQLLRILGDLKK